MISFKNISIKKKLVVIILSTSMAAVFIGLTTHLVYDMYGAREYMKKNARLNADLISEYSVAPIVFDFKEEAQEVLTKLIAIPSILDACLYKTNGEVFVEYHKSKGDAYHFTPLEKRLKELEGGVLNVYHDITNQGQHYGVLYLRVSTSYMNEILISHLVMMFGLMLLLIITIYFIAFRVQKIISAPILNLANLTDQISKNHDFSIKLTAQSNDEVGILYRQFSNLMAELLKRQQQRDLAEEEIRSLNASLERKVQERTAMLESANKELEAFSYSVSHDLRAPLRHINGYLDLLSKRAFDKMDEKGKHYMQSISEAAIHMGNLIDDLLKFSRTSRMEMRMDKIDMNRVIHDALTLLEPEMKDRRIEWEMAEMPVVYGDNSMLRQVWVNLLSNAVKYTKNREIAHIQTGYHDKEEEYVFFVRDDGAGFDMNYAQKLFGVFQRLHAAEEFEGTGIGLANVRQVIKRHKGKTWAEGEVDKGACFYFSLPKIQEE